MSAGPKLSQVMDVCLLLHRPNFEVCFPQDKASFQVKTVRRVSGLFLRETLLLGVTVSLHLRDKKGYFFKQGLDSILESFLLKIGSFDRIGNLSFLRGCQQVTKFLYIWKKRALFCKIGSNFYYIGR